MFPLLARIFRMHLTAFPLLVRIRRMHLPLAILFVAACGGDHRDVPLIRGVVDTFETGDGISAQGSSWEVITEGPGTFAEIYFPEGGFEEASRYHLSLEGVRPRDAAGSHVVGVRVSLMEAPPPADPDQEERAADLTAYDGLAFAMRGTPGTYIVQLGSTLVEDFDYFNSYVEVTGDWHEFRIPFERFEQEGFGQRIEWQRRQASHVGFFANLVGSFRFSIDDVRFYRDGQP